MSLCIANQCLELSCYGTDLHLVSVQASEAYLQTNNQYLSLTDQLNLGVRIVELDTHFFDVRLHCTYDMDGNMFV